MTREEAITVLNMVEAHGSIVIEAKKMAIEALSAEPCEDAISREEAIRIASGYCHWSNIPDELAKLPSVQPKARWVPVSERLPEDFQRVLVTIVNYNGNRIVRVAEYLKGVFRVMENHERWEVGEKGLLAWMPLPEPYKGGE